MRSRHHRRRQSGLTLMEVMVGMVLVGILVIGMNALWEAAARQLDDVSLRQRAVFRLNGEMERLSALYVFGTGPTGPVAVTDYATATIPARAGSYITATTGTRTIYAETQPGTVSAAVPMMAPSTDLANRVAADGSDANTVYGRIYYLDAGVPNTTADDRNLVWLDRENGVLAQISWETQDLPNTDPTGIRPCNAGTCKLLTLYLDYPFRYASPAADPRGDMGPVETITLQTIVGQRP